MVNGAQTLVSRVILDLQSNLPYFDTLNFTYYCPSYLYTAEQQYIVEL